MSSLSDSQRARDDDDDAMTAYSPRGVILSRSGSNGTDSVRGWGGWEAYDPPMRVFLRGLACKRVGTRRCGPNPQKADHLGCLWGEKAWVRGWYRMTVCIPHYCTLIAWSTTAMVVLHFPRMAALFTTSDFHTTSSFSDTKNEAIACVSYFPNM